MPGGRRAWSSIVCVWSACLEPPRRRWSSAQRRRRRARGATPNIVLMYPDNLGYGEVGIYGGNRGVPTPRIDALAREGMRLTNFNVETFCTPSRAALLTGRYGVRSGTLGYTQPWPGMTLWETTLAELLAPRGYTSAMFGKWHLGNAAGRAPTHQGFDEWYGIRDSSNESQRSTMDDTPYIWEGKAGEPSRPVKEFNLDTRRTVDRESTERAVAFMTRSTQSANAVLPLPPVHADPLPDAAAPGVRGHDRRRRHRRRDGGDGSQRRRRPGRDQAARHRAEHDRDLGERRRRGGAPAVARDVGTVARLLQHGDGGRHPHAVHDPLAGPHPRGSGLERDRAQHRRVHDARARGRRRRCRRTAPSTASTSCRSSRASSRSRTATASSISRPDGQVRAVKWGDWKLHYVWQDEPGQPVERTMKLFNLRSDPKEETDIKDANPWVPSAIGKLVNDFWATAGQVPADPRRHARPVSAPGRACCGSAAVDRRSGHHAVRPQLHVHDAWHRAAAAARRCDGDPRHRPLPGRQGVLEHAHGRRPVPSTRSVSTA